MEYTKLNFTIYQGEDREIYLSFFNTVNNEKQKIDLTNSKFIMTIRAGINQSIIDELSSDNKRIKLGLYTDSGFIESNESPNTLQLIFTNNITEKYNIPTMVYDIFRYDNNKKELLIFGNINILKSVLNND